MSNGPFWQGVAFAYLDGDLVDPDPLMSQPEEVHEQVNAHQDAFRSEEDIRQYVDYLKRHS